jgi:hypothetical protein
VCVVLCVWLCACACVTCVCVCLCVFCGVECFARCMKVSCVWYLYLDLYCFGCRFVLYSVLFPFLVLAANEAAEPLDTRLMFSIFLPITAYSPLLISFCFRVLEIYHTNEAINTGSLVKSDVVSVESYSFMYRIMYD